MKPDLMTYYFPNWHVDKFNENLYGTGFTEWNVVKCARPKFEGHDQPKVPLWGYEDESLPSVMEKKIDFAAGHAITGFLFDWYWTDEGPHRHKCLDEGFLKAANRDRLKFAIMFCNHAEGQQTPTSYYDMKNGTWLTSTGHITPETFRASTDYCIRNYFSQENYYRTDGRLYYSFFRPDFLLKDLGGVGGTRAMLEEFRGRVRSAGLGELNLAAYLQLTPGYGEDAGAAAETLKQAGFDSVFYHNLGFDDDIPFPYCRYERAFENCKKAFERDRKPVLDKGLAYYITASVGWDPSPRTVQSDMYVEGDYPFNRIVHDATPEKFREQLAYWRAYCEKNEIPLLTLFAFNEWTEGSYLEPDKTNGDAYARAVADVFGD